MKLLSPGHSEICDLEDPVVEENVCRFEIAMDYGEFVEIRETLAYLEEHVD